MQKANVKAYVSAIQGAALSRRAALQVEIAVGFAVCLEVGPSKRLARAQLCEIYAAAGYHCSEPKDIDWKAINRRITGALALWDFLGAEEIAKWAEGHSKNALIDALVEKIAPLKLNTINEVLLICHKVKPQHKRQINGTPIATEHLRIVVPPTATAEELFTVASHLMDMAKELMPLAA
jgi:hypothetical protein